MARTLNHIDVIRQAPTAARARLDTVLGIRRGTQDDVVVHPQRPDSRVGPVRDDRHARHRRAELDRRRRPVDGFRLSDRRRFRRLVVDALVDLPSPLRQHLEQVRLTVEDLPSAAYERDVPLGRYVAAAPRRGQPSDRLTLYRRPLEARATSMDDLADLVRRTVTHEVGHHLGFTDDDLDDRGWG